MVASKKFFGDLIPVKVSAKSAGLRFIECGPVCISKGCTSKCCDAPTHPDGMRVSIQPNEQAALKALGARVVDGFLKPAPGTKGCPFKTSGHLCGLHGTPDKPFGCIASPFALNKNNTLIIRNRYKLLPCYAPDEGEPAYKVFSSSLLIIFGKDKTYRLIRHLENGGGDIVLGVKNAVYQKLQGREKALQKKTNPD